MTVTDIFWLFVLIIFWRLLVPRDIPVAYPFSLHRPPHDSDALNPTTTGTYQPRSLGTPSVLDGIYHTVYTSNHAD